MDPQSPTNSGVAHDSMPTSEPLGRRGFLKGVGAVAGAGAVAGVLPVGEARADVTLPDTVSAYAPLPKAVRVVDTRTARNYTFERLNDRRIRLAISGNYGVPADATAVVATVTGVNKADPNYVSVFPSGGSIPVVSNLNLAPYAINANLAIVKLGTKGSVDLFSRVPCDVIFDVLGYFTPVDGPVSGGRFVDLPIAQRAIDTRPASVASGSITTVDLTAYVPATASGAVINLTATECTGPGYFTAFPYTESTVPKASSLNVLTFGETRAAAVIVPISDVGGRRQIKVFTLTEAKLIVDVIGYFTDDTTAASKNGLFVPVDPVRALDTREPGQIGKLWPQWVVEAKVPDADKIEAGSIVANLTGVDTRGPGYLTLSAARRPIPPTSNVNWTYGGAVVPNLAFTPITAQYGVQAYSSHGCHVLIDYFGYFTGTPKPPTLAAYVNPPPPSIAPPWRIVVPRLGVDHWVYDGDPIAITDAGHTWHWTGTGDLGQNANIAVFGHRTEAGGPYRNIHTMVPGDRFLLYTSDGREFTYEIPQGEYRYLTDKLNSNILNAVRAQPAPTLAIVACTIGFDNAGNDRYIPSVPESRWWPTSLGWRIVVVGRLVGWREL